MPRFDRLPWWLLFLLLTGAALTWKFCSGEVYGTIFWKLLGGVTTTLWVTAASFSLALALGLLAGIGRTSEQRWARELATLYVQVARGVPVLVQLFYVAFVLLPWCMDTLAATGLVDVKAKDIPMALRVVAALAFAYGGFEAETFRAGIESIAPGQLEAARSLGMTRGQTLRRIVLPQAVRRMLPTFGNDLISMLKDSSLVSVLGVGDIMQQARLHTATTFLYPETYTMLAVFYLTLTLALSMGVKLLEGKGQRK